MFEKSFIQVIKGKSVEFTVSLKTDYQTFVNHFEIPEIQAQFDEEGCQHQITRWDATTRHKDHADFDEIQAELEKIKNLLDSDTFAQDVLDAMDRKANGTLAKGRVYYPYIFPWGQEWEDSYCIAHPAIKAKSMSDTAVEITYDYYKDKW